MHTEVSIRHLHSRPPTASSCSTDAGASATSNFWQSMCSALGRVDYGSFPHLHILIVDVQRCHPVCTFSGCSTGAGALRAGKTCSRRPWKMLPSIAAIAVPASSALANCTYPMPRDFLVALRNPCNSLVTLLHLSLCRRDQWLSGKLENSVLGCWQSK